MMTSDEESTRDSHRQRREVAGHLVPKSPTVPLPHVDRAIAFLDQGAVGFDGRRTRDLRAVVNCASRHRHEDGHTRSRRGRRCGAEPSRRMLSCQRIVSRLARSPSSHLGRGTQNSQSLSLLARTRGTEAACAASSTVRALSVPLATKGRRLLAGRRATCLDSTFRRLRSHRTAARIPSAQAR